MTSREEESSTFTDLVLWWKKSSHVYDKKKGRPEKTRVKSRKFVFKTSGGKGKGRTGRREKKENQVPRVSRPDSWVQRRIDNLSARESGEKGGK